MCVCASVSVWVSVLLFGVYIRDNDRIDKHSPTYFVRPKHV